MGVKQSSPAANGRARAYSGSAVPESGNGTGRTAAPLRFAPHGAPGAPAAAAQHAGPRPRSVGGGGGTGSAIAVSGPRESGSSSSSSPEERAGESGGAAAGGRAGTGAPRLLIGSLPTRLNSELLGGFKCPVCSKFIPSNEMELHLVMCLTKPRVTYNEDVLSKEAGECAICLEELLHGDVIARLPCLCIYHKSCIDEWFEVNRWCPEHPSD